MEPRLFRTDYYTHIDKKTGKVDKRIACEVWLYNDWRYDLKFVTLV